jgi:MFS family permease
MVSGISVLMASPVIVPAMKKAFDIDYSQGASSLVLTPYLVEMLTVPLSGWLYDKIDIMRFRALNALFWATSRLSLLLGLLFHNWPLVLTGFAIQGLGCSTGGVVWSIGHMRFARVEESQLYMGVHLSLQGLRGLTMPFLGMWLYSIPWINLHVMTIAVVIQFVAVCEFFLLREQPPSAEGK